MSKVDNVSRSVLGAGVGQPRDVGDDGHGEQRKSAANPKKKGNPKKMKSNRKAKSNMPSSSAVLLERDEVPRNVVLGNTSLKETLQSMLMAATTSYSRMEAQKENKNVAASTTISATSATRACQTKIGKLSETIMKAQQKVEKNIMIEGQISDVSQLQITQKMEAGKRFKVGRHENVLRVQDLEGYRGEDDIEKILEFNESNDDKKVSEGPENPKKKKNQTRKQPMKSSDDDGSYHPTDLQLLAEKAGFALNFQYGKFGGCDEKGVVDFLNKPKKRLLNPSTTDSLSVAIKSLGDNDPYHPTDLHVLAEKSGFTLNVQYGKFGGWGGNGSMIPPEEGQQKDRVIVEGAAELKRLAHDGIITFKFA